MDNKVIEEEFFFSDNFLIQLRFANHGLVDGWVVHYPIGLNLAQDFRGFFIDEAPQRKVVFFIEWDNPNLSDKVLTAYSGEITQSEGDVSRLVLEWLQLTPIPAGITSCYKGCEILSNVPPHNFIEKERRHFLKN